LEGHPSLLLIFKVFPKHKKKAALSS
jgi:hypothetical protein